MSFKDFYTRNFKRNFSKFYFEEKKKRKPHPSANKTFVYRWVHPSAIPYVATYGILGYGAALDNDDVVDGLGDMAESKLQSLAVTGDGPTFLTAPPPSLDILNKNHPAITKQLVLVKIDLSNIIEDNPDIVIKFVDHDKEFSVDELKTIQTSGKGWDRYDNNSPTHEYALNVPKVMIGNQNTIIDPKYIVI